MTSLFKIQCLIPDLPAPADVAPYLQEMSEARWYSNFGPLNNRFEHAIADFLVREKLAVDTPLCVTFSSATAALELALKALALPAGGKVLVPALTFPATALAVISAGLVPVFCDVDPASWMLEPALAAKSLTKDTVAVMPVTTYAKPVDAHAWATFQQTHQVPVVVDAAASLGQQEIDTALTFVFSLHATKPFGVGEGGLLVTGDEALSARARSLSNFGFEGPAGVIQALGTNAKMGEYYAAVALAQMARWHDVHGRRAELWAQYRDMLANFGADITLQKGAADFVPGTLMVSTKEHGLRAHHMMAQVGVQTRRWYLPPLYEHPALKAYAGPVHDYPVSERLKKDLMGLPFHGFLGKHDLDLVKSVIERVLEA